MFQGLAAFLKAIGYLIPLMDAEYANYYTREVMLILIREFQSPDEEMKKIVLKVCKILFLTGKVCGNIAESTQNILKGDHSYQPKKKMIFFQVFSRFS